MNRIIASLLAFLLAVAPVVAHAENYGATPTLDIPAVGQGNWGTKLQDNLKDLIDFNANYANADGTLKTTTTATPWQQVTGPVTRLSGTSFKVPSTALFDDIGRKVWVTQSPSVIGEVQTSTTAAGETTVVLSNIVLYSDNVTPTSLSGTISSVAVSMATPRSSFYASNIRKNLLVNGAMFVAQRGSSFTSAGYTLDRWYVDAAGSSGFTVSRQAGGGGFQYALRVQRNSGQTWTTSTRLAQALETVSSIPAQGRAVTLSFWARAGANYSSANSYLYSTLRSGTGTDQSISTMINGTWTGAASEDKAHTLTTNWQRFSHTWLCASGSKQIGVQISSIKTGTAGADDWFEIGNMQLEIGEFATEFESLAYSATLAECRRWLLVYGGEISAERIAQGFMDATLTDGKAVIHFPVKMRSIPSLTYSALGDFQIAGVTSELRTPTAITLATPTSYSTGLNVSWTPNMGNLGGPFFFNTVSANARLILSSEL